MSRQNIYDDERFFRGYRDLRIRGLGFNTAVEEPAMARHMPTLAGKSIVNLGCGDGAACLAAARAGASSVVGVDPSTRMLEIAARQAAHPAVTYLRAFAEDADFPAGTVDVVVSSLALHYVQDIGSLFARIAGWLVPRGVLVFSIEHPVITASPSGAREDGWLLTDYFAEGPRHTTWFIEDVVKYHRTAGTIVSSLLNAHFSIEALDEPSPTTAAVAVQKSLTMHLNRPALLVIRARRSRR